MKAEIKNIRALISSLKSKGYVVYEQPYQLNIVGIRSNSTQPNKFDDFIYAFWKNEQGQWEGKYFTATTDPGTYYLKNPLSNLGTAILKEGQYVDTYAIGKHKGQYDALTQQKPVTVIRDYDRNAILDFNNGREEKGLFGINIHKAGKDSSEVNTWSAGCQVFQKSDDFADFMDLARKHKEKYGNKFTYTLIDERAYNRGLKRKGTYLLAGLLLVGALWVGIRSYKRKSITKLN
jgi:hypothetical protein